MKPQLILLGAPGSGKGTQAAKIVSEFGYDHVSTGDLLRAEIAKQSELGKRVKSIMDAGNLVDDQTVLELLKANCDISSNAYIFDGFPRNADQAKALDQVVLGDANAKAIYFKIDLEILVERIANRRIAPKSGRIYNLVSNPPKKEGICDESGEELVHRKDDNEDVVRNRLNVFKETIDPVLDYYKSKGMLIEVDAMSGQDDVFAQISSIINN